MDMMGRGPKREREKDAKSQETRRDTYVTHTEKKRDLGRRQRPLKGKEILRGGNEEIGGNRPRDIQGESSEIKGRRHL